MRTLARNRLTKNTSLLHAKVKRQHLLQAYCFPNSIYLLGIVQLVKVCYLLHKVAFPMRQYLLGIVQIVKVCYLLHKIAFPNASISLEHHKGYMKMITLFIIQCTNSDILICCCCCCLIYLKPVKYTKTQIY